MRTTKDLINKIRNDLTKVEKAYGLAVAATHAEVVDRIFEEGENNRGGKIGTYSTKPIYVNPDYSPKKFAPKGKTGRTSFNNGKKHKTGYFESGYKGFRQAIGRESNKVNLRLFGTLQSDFSNSLEKRQSGLYVTGIKNKANAGKIEGIQYKYGNVFLLQKDERKLLVTTFQKELNRLVR